MLESNPMCISRMVTRHWHEATWSPACGNIGRASTALVRAYLHTGRAPCRVYKQPRRCVECIPVVANGPQRSQSWTLSSKHERETHTRKLRMCVLWLDNRHQRAKPRRKRTISSLVTPCRQVFTTQDAFSIISRKNNSTLRGTIVNKSYSRKLLPKTRNYRFVESLNERDNIRQLNDNIFHHTHMCLVGVEIQIETTYAHRIFN